MKQDEFQALALKTIKTWSAKSLASTDPRHKGRKSCTILQAARHCLREFGDEVANASIDRKLSRFNRVLTDPARSASDIAALADRLAAQAGAKPKRADTATAFELVVSLRPGSRVDDVPFFDESLAWSKGWFSSPLLLAVVHLDQPQKHMHAIFSALCGGEFNATALMGDRTRINAMRADFHKQVGRRYGLRKSDKAFRIDAIRGDRITSNLMRRLMADDADAVEYELISVIHRLIHQNLPKVLADIGVELTERSLAEITATEF